MSRHVRIAIAALPLLILTAQIPSATLAQEDRPVRTAAINGMEMSYVSVGEGEPLLLLHGFMQTGHAYDQFVDAFSAQYRLVIPDLRGHGASTNPSGEFTMQQSARDILALLDHLEIEKCRAVGISAGAVTLLHLVTRHPERVEALVLVGSGTYYPVHCRETLGAYDADAYPEAGWTRLRAMHKHGDEQIRMLFRQLAGFADSYDDLTFTPPTLAAIQAPVLFVHGDRDYCFPVSMVSENYDAIPNAYLWIVPNGGHVPIHGRWAPVFSETVLDFFAGKLEGS